MCGGKLMWHKSSGAGELPVLRGWPRWFECIYTSLEPFRNRIKDICQHRSIILHDKRKGQSVSKQPSETGIGPSVHWQCPLLDIHYSRDRHRRTEFGLCPNFQIFHSQCLSGPYLFELLHRTGPMITRRFRHSLKSTAVAPLLGREVGWGVNEAKPVRTTGGQLARNRISKPRALKQRRLNASRFG